MVLIFISISAAIFVYLIIMLLSGRSSDLKIKKRLSYLAQESNLDSVHDDVIREKQKRATEGKSRLISQKMTDSLALAGVELNAGEYLVVWACAALLPGVVMTLLGKNILSVLGVSLIGFSIPPFLVQRSRKKKQELFNKQLGQSLVIMGNSMKSGYSFQQAMQSIAADMQPPISVEFEKTLREIRYGVRQEDALNHLAERVQNQDLELLISAVTTSLQVGSNLSEIIDNISVTIRDRVKIRDDVRNMSAQGRISGLIIGLLPVVLFLMLMIVNPGYVMAFFENALGKAMVAAGIVLELVGFAVIRKIVDIKY